MEMVFKDQFTDSVIIDASDHFHYNFESRSSGTLFLTISNAENCDLNFDVKEDADIKVFIHNQSNTSCHLNIHVSLNKDAKCQMGLLDMENTPLYWKHFVELNETGASFEILSGQLCMSNIDKICDMEVRHNAPHTVGEIKNFAVLMNQGHYEMVANGNITKGCFDAHSHQATRVLTLGKDHVTKCIPLLLIDENDVRASHALSVGQPDEDQMYYLQSRGLTKQQAIGLLSVGYLLPVIQMVEDKSLQEKLQVEMEGKVGLYGSK